MARTSRLKRTENRRALRSTLLYIVLIVGTIYLLLNFGLPALSKITELITSSVKQDSVDGGLSGPPPPPPQIKTLPADTKERKLKVEGNTRPGYTINLFFNDEKNEILADARGEFTGVFELSIGKNTIRATATDNSGKESASTRTYDVNFDNEPPNIGIIAPENDKEFFGRDSQVKIEGETEPGNSAYINDRTVIVRSDGKFDSLVSLSEGDNVFKIKAVDPAGNESEIELKLRYVR